MGTPGIGKTHVVLANYRECTYEKSQNKWFDGYCNQRIVLLDDLDFEGGNKLGHYLKRWSDKWICQAECKGATLQLKHEWFVVTSNYSINDVFGPSEQDNSETRIQKRILCEAISRRFTVFSAYNREEMESVSVDIKRLLSSSNIKPLPEEVKCCDGNRSRSRS